MKCQILFSQKNKKNMFVEFANRVVKIKHIYSYKFYIIIYVA